MCGFSIIFNKAPRYISENDHDITNMVNAIGHRGKDQVSIKYFNEFTVGFRRLAITDLGTVQPHVGEWTVYINGEVYNYKDLGFIGSETSVISQGLEKHGLDFVKRLNGMFVIVAIKGDQLYIIRDRYGIKPIYYFEGKSSIVIASEIKSIITHPEYSFVANKNAMRQWFVFNNILTDETLFDKIYKLDKGTIWHVNTGKKEKYWSWRFHASHEYTISNLSTIHRDVRDLVLQAIKRQTPEEVEYGSCLSGGVDSNIIVKHSGDIFTFNAGFKQGPDESTLAALYGKKHYSVFYDKIRHFEETIYHLEDLRVGASWSNYGLYELASKYVKVLFDGAGADEIFGGYVWRYEAKDYYNQVVNRTGVYDSYCMDVFLDVFKEDTTESRFEFDANYFLEGVLQVVDKISMAHTIETRVPFLDNDLVDYCLNYIPSELRYNKQVLKSAFMDLPLEIRMAKKQGFSSPDWFEGDGNQAYKWAKASYTEWFKQYGS